MEAELRIVHYHGEPFLQILSHEGSVLKEDSIRKILMEDNALAAKILADLQGCHAPKTSVDELTAQQLYDVVRLLQENTEEGD